MEINNRFKPILIVLCSTNCLVEIFTLIVSNICLIMLDYTSIKAGMQLNIRKWCEGYWVYAMGEGR